MKRILYVFFAVGLLTLASCTGDLEKRVTDLERRVAALEGNGGSNTNSSAANQNRNNNMLESQTQIQNQAQQPNQKPEGPLPTMEFKEKVHDFGRITEGEVVKKIFQFKNTGDAPLIISNATSSCGCTVPKYHKNEPIAPGEEGEIEVEYNSRGKRNQDNKVVRITANTWPSTTNLTIKVFVEPKGDVPNAGPIKQ